MRDQTYHITTFGCQMNEHDSEKLAGMLVEMGYWECDQKQAADVVILNTCSVREHADERFFGILGQLKKLKEDAPDKIIAVCGCMMQQQHIIDKLKAKYPWVDLIFGTHNLQDFPRLLTNAIEEKVKIVDIWQENGDICEGLPAKRKYAFKAFVSIMYGCNNFCSYCIVPFTRGRERSRNPEEIIAEITDLVSQGVVEVTLLGQNVNSYGNDSSFGMSFSELIHRLNAIQGLARIRFMTSHPKDLSDDLIEAFRSCDKLSKHIHLPVQSGSNRILERMNRNYTRESYLTIIAKLKATVPDLAVTTDFIVGFPGETEEDFMDTLRLASEVEFDSAYTFLYSIRQGTPAESFDEQVPEELKHSRFNRLVERLNHYAALKNKAYVGRVVPILVEGLSKNNKTIYAGRTDSNKLVNFKNSCDAVGKIIDVRITEARTFNLYGEACDTGEY